MTDFLNPQPQPLPQKRAFVHPIRKDGKYPVTFVYPVSGTRLKKLIPAADLDAKLVGYDVVRVAGARW